jgi:DNA-binding NarL/FixJ family response regulator
VNPQGLVQDALSSLLRAHSYQVVGTCSTIQQFDDIQRAALDDVDLTILSGQNVEDTLKAAEVLFAARPSGKIVYLFDELSSDEVRRISNSPISGCISLNASQEVLLQALEFVVDQNFRIFSFYGASPTERRDRLKQTQGQIVHGNGSSAPSKRGLEDGVRSKDHKSTDPLN